MSRFCGPNRAEDPRSVLGAPPSAGRGGWSTLGKGSWGASGSLGTGGLHTCEPSGCAHTPQGAGDLGQRPA